jgi:hypothetical protein
MKKLFAVLVLIFVGINGNSQKLEGSIRYEVKAVEVDSSLTSVENKDVYKGSLVEIFYTEKKSRLNYVVPKMMSVSLICDYQKDQGLQLYNSKFGKFARTGKADEMRLADNTDSATVELTDETKKILGYSCKKAIVHSKKGDSEWWYTNDLSIDLKGLINMSDKIPGFPMAFTTNIKGVVFYYEAIVINKAIENKEVVFDMTIPEGYTLKNEATEKTDSKKD